MLSGVYQIAVRTVVLMRVGYEAGGKVCDDGSGKGECSDEDVW